MGKRKYPKEFKAFIKEGNEFAPVTGESCHGFLTLRPDILSRCLDIGCEECKLNEGRNRAKQITSDIKKLSCEYPEKFKAMIKSGKLFIPTTTLSCFGYTFERFAPDRCDSICEKCRLNTQHDFNSVEAIIKKKAKWLGTENGQ